MSDEVRMRLDLHEKRIKKIEDILFSKAEQDIKILQSCIKAYPAESII